MTLLLAEVGDSALESSKSAFPRCQSISYMVIFKNSGPQMPENMHLQTHCSCAVKTDDSQWSFIHSHTWTLILFQIQVDGGFLW